MTFRKVSIWILILAVIWAVGMTFYTTIIKKDFSVVNTEEL
jgi:hypothetical protein